MKIMSKLLCVVAVAAAMLATTTSNAQTIDMTPDSTIGMQSNGFGNAFFGPGTAGGGNFQNSALIAYRVQDILTDTGLSLGALSTQTFTLSFDTDASINLEAANGTPGNPAEYIITYTGFYANTGGGAPFNPSILGNTTSAVNTGIVDTLAAQTGISGDFTLTGVSEGDSADDWIGFRVVYANPYFQQASNTIQPISNVQLTTVIPEPSSFALMALGMGGLYLLRRRRS
jgi:hypothetical protein